MTVTCADYPIAKVTRGEWGDEFPTIRLVGNSLDLKAEAYMDRIAYGFISNETAIANGRLIAAAPELYTALKSVLVLARVKWGNLDIGANYHFEKAEAALANASGIETRRAETP